MNLLYLVHRLPYPPNKGDKVRSFHLLKHLAARHRVFLGTFIDDPDDEAHVAQLQPLCAGMHVERLNAVRARLASLAGLVDGKPLTLHYYRAPALRRWVETTASREAIDAVIVFSSSMAQYAQTLDVPMLVDFVDVDSVKWTDYAGHRRWPMSWLYRREGEQLLAFERATASRATRSFFVTDKETALFRRLAPECAALVESSGNGVDAVFFAPEPTRLSPFADDEIPIVFTGAMDYWPNVDAVVWFANAMLPQLLAKWPDLRFHIVGRNPAAAVRALASESVSVTGTVPDIRPYLQHAQVIVAPLRLARGIQNKILEAMAMSRPVVAARVCADVLSARSGEELMAADDAPGFIHAIDVLLNDRALASRIGDAGRACILRNYSWDAQLVAFDGPLSQISRAADALRAA